MNIVVPWQAGQWIAFVSIPPDPFSKPSLIKGPLKAVWLDGKESFNYCHFMDLGAELLTYSLALPEAGLFALGKEFLPSNFKIIALSPQETQIAFLKFYPDDATRNLFSQLFVKRGCHHLSRLVAEAVRETLLDNEETKSFRLQQIMVCDFTPEWIQSPEERIIYNRALSLEDGIKKYFPFPKPISEQTPLSCPVPRGEEALEEKTYTYSLPSPGLSTPQPSWKRSEGKY